MASIKKRDNGQWRARYRDAAGREHARHFPRKVDAQRWLDEVTASVVTGQYVDPRAGKVTFRSFFDDWSARQVWAAGTLTSARQAVYSTPFLDAPMKSIRRSDLEAWVKGMTTSLADSTTRTRFNYVHMALRAAVGDRVIPSAPSAGVRLPKPTRSDTLAIPASDDVAAAMKVAPVHFRPFVAVCAFAGLRLGEAAGLHVEDVDFLRRRIHVRRQVQGATNTEATVTDPKAGSVRTVPVPEDLTLLLSAHVRDVGIREPWLLSNGPELWNRNSAGEQWRRIRDEVPGLTGFTLHSLRHFFASGLIAAGCDVVTVQRALGHSTPSITLDVYSHLWPDAEDRTRAAAEGIMASVLPAPADSLRTAGDFGPDSQGF